MTGKKQTKVKFNATIVKFSDEDLRFPIVYSPSYKIGLINKQTYNKGEQVMKILLKQRIMLPGRYYVPNDYGISSLISLHDVKYIEQLKSSRHVAKITMIRWLMFFPNKLLNIYILRPLRMQSSGTVMAGLLALKKGWSINMGGGFHESCRFQGSGLSIYADITLLIKTILDLEAAWNFMIVDLNAKPSTGPILDFENSANVYIFDMHNSSQSPEIIKDQLSSIKLLPFVNDETYLAVLSKSLDASIKTFHPDLIIYNAGIDILEGNSKTQFAITADGILKRDEIVFRMAKDHDVPICMLLSAGYGSNVAKVIADSIINLNRIGLIQRFVPR